MTLELAAEFGSLDDVLLLFESDDRAQYMRAIRFAFNNGYRAVARHLASHRPWTAEDHHLWQRTDVADRVHPCVWDRMEWKQHNLEEEKVHSLLEFGGAACGSRCGRGNQRGA